MQHSVSTPIAMRLAPCVNRGPDHGVGYRVAGQSIVSDVPVDLLAAYLEDFDRPLPLGPKAGERGSGAHGRVASGWLAGRDRRLSCGSDGSEFVIGIEGVGQYCVDRNSGAIACLAAHADPSRAVLEEALLGPPLSFALLSRGIWSVHASAVMDGTGAVLFLGASGAGKSTLAQWLADYGEPPWRCVADDIVCCSVSEGVPYAHFHFPQLKWSGDRQYALAEPSDRVIRAFVVLNPLPPGREPWLEPLSLAEAAKALAEQTLSVKLFDRELHLSHLRWLGDTVAAAKLYRLDYPHDAKRLARVGGLLESLRDDA